MERFVWILELVGTVAFAISGAVVGLRKRMDVFGVIILGVTTAVGGGVLRDVILGDCPPAMFRHPIYALCAVAVSVLMFLPCVHRRFLPGRPVHVWLLRITDALGLGIFVVSGVRISLACAGENLFLAVFVGTVTGVGGGVLRDVLAGDTPSIFVRHIYACAAIAGALACYLLWSLAGAGAAMLIGLVLVVVLRLVAAYFNWNLPRAEVPEQMLQN